MLEHIFEKFHQMENRKISFRPAKIGAEYIGSSLQTNNPA